MHRIVGRVRLAALLIAAIAMLLWPVSAARAADLEEPQITGTLTEAGTGNPLVGVDVRVYSPDPESPGEWTECGWGNTGADGSYDAWVGGAGTYKVVFAPDGRYLGAATKWWPSATSLAGATPIVTTESFPGRSGVDAQLTRHSGEIGGRLTVTGATAPFTASVRLYVYESRYDYWESITSVAPDSGGNYLFTGLADATYRVGFQVSELGIDVAYGGADQVDDGSDVVVFGGAHLAGISQTVIPAISKISGTITGVVGEAPNVKLWKENESTHRYEDTYWSYTYDDNTNNYEFTYLPAGTYKVSVADGSQVGYAPQWYSNKATEAIATAITLTGANEQTGVNFSMARYTGSIAGRVTDKCTCTPMTPSTTTGGRSPTP
jgi:hypothetical protein